VGGGGGGGGGGLCLPYPKLEGRGEKFVDPFKVPGKFFSLGKRSRTTTHPC